MPEVKYTCQDYRREMILVGLKRQLARADLTEEETLRIVETIRELEEEIGLA